MLVLDASLDESLDGPEEHVEVGLGVGAADGRLVDVYFEGRFLVHEVVREVLNDLPSDHPLQARSGLPGDVVPELEVVGELGPAFRHRVGKHVKKAEEGVADELVLLRLVLLHQGKLPTVHKVAYNGGEEGTHFGTHFQVRVLHQQRKEEGLVNGEEAGESLRMLPQVKLKGKKQIFKGGRFEPKAECEFLGNGYGLIAVCFRHHEYLGKEFGECGGGKTLFEEMYLVIQIYFSLQLLLHERRN